MFNRKLREKNIALMGENNVLKNHVLILDEEIEKLLREKTALQKDNSWAIETILMLHKETERLQQENKKLVEQTSPNVDCKPVPACDSEGANDSMPEPDRLTVLEKRLAEIYDLFWKSLSRIENLEAAINPDVIQAWKKQVANLIAANEKLKKKAKR